ncbi:putative DNA-binding domain-containing protein [Celerinatantimonas sp. YJH-8]|uniref:HvfC/BufC family peptide modification chaperone n=1 Tax=Celerinatantimonas sp. YJH-8 TaxID=3228714 RepID=UPI0038C00CC5
MKMNDAFSEMLLGWGESVETEKIRSMVDHPERLDIYRHNYVISLTEALSEIFHVTKQVVGDDFFREMARRYIRQYPPDSVVLSDYGQHFSSFIASFEAAKPLPFLSELAGLERTLLNITHQPDEQGLPIQALQEQLQQHSGESLQFNLLASTQLWVSQYPVGAIYAAHQLPDDEQIGQAVAAIDLNVSNYLLLFKSGMRACLEILDYPMACFIRSLRQDASVELALQAAGETLDLSQALQLLIQWQLIAGIKGESDDGSH